MSPLYRIFCGFLRVTYPDSRSNLGQYLSAYPVLKIFCHAKQKLNRLLLLKTTTRKAAQRELPKLLSLLEQLKTSPLRGLANTFTSWLEPIVGMWRFSKKRSGAPVASLKASILRWK
jgi:transposase